LIVLNNPGIPESFPITHVDIEDQRENDRREREVARIAGLSAQEQEIAVENEARKQAEYEASRSRGGSSVRDPATIV